MQIFITKRDGTRESFDADKINRSIARACEGLPNADSLTMQIATETRLTLYDGITTEELDRATIEAAVQNIKDDPVFNRAATRLLLKVIYKKALGNYTTHEELKRLYRERFTAYIERGIALGFLDPRLKERFDLHRLAEAINPERDELFTYTGLDTLMKRYSIQEKGSIPLEPPQYLFMRIAMGIALDEPSADDWAIRFYEKMSKHEYIAGGSTNVNAGTQNPRLSNCFLIDMQDDMEHIAKSVSDVLLIAKATGGIGMTVTRLRAEGSPLGNTNTVSSGPIPFMKIVDTSIRAVIRAGKKVGALCFYMENWHYNFDEFLDLKQNAGDDYLRARTANTAAYLSDEFMQRVVSDEDWYQFDPWETPELIELSGEAFSKKYREYVAKAEAGQMRLVKKSSAREQFRRIIVSLQTTSHPWITWKDPINLRALNDNTGVINGSNLCTEITLPHNRENTAVCNLLSVNIAKHIRSGVIEWQKLEQSVRLGVRHLDNLVDVNRLPVAEAVKSDKENRAVGLGVMGVSDALEQLTLSYDSEEAFEFVDRVFEFISYMAIDESTRLAKDRGIYPNFEGSGWSRGMVPIDTLDRLERERGRTITIKKESAHRGLDWDALRRRVKEGMRNATVLAVAPNANIGLVAGTSPGIDPRFTQMFSRNKYSGKYLEVNSNLVMALQSRGLWDKVKDQILEAQGDVSEIDEVPDDVKAIYKTSFTLPPSAFIEVAARAQKWVDQALSRNMYLAIRDADEVMGVYTQAWEKGLKTTYYLHMKPRHRAEQSTVKVNKATKLGKKGFGMLRKEAETITRDGATAAEPVTVEAAEYHAVPGKQEQSSVPPVLGAGFAKVAARADEVAPAAPLPFAKQETAASQASTGRGFSAAVPGVQKTPSAPTARPAVAPFAKVAAQAPAATKVSATRSSADDDDLVDPMERNVCDSCQ